jgi:hypothetical protein
MKSKSLLSIWMTAIFALSAAYSLNASASWGDDDRLVHAQSASEKRDETKDPAWIKAYTKAKLDEYTRYMKAQEQRAIDKLNRCENRITELRHGGNADLRFERVRNFVSDFQFAVSHFIQSKPGCVPSSAFDLEDPGNMEYDLINCGYTLSECEKELASEEKVSSGANAQLVPTKQEKSSVAADPNPSSPGDGALKGASTASIAR